MKIIIFDYEVFKYDTLLGALLINEDNSQKLFQTWDVKEIENFYLEHENCFWIGHNNINYDNIILEGVLNHKKPYDVNLKIITSNFRPKSRVPKFNYDLMNNDFYSLKVTEAAVGKNISETEVDFNLDRHLTEEEKKSTEGYNKDDLYQTFDNFNSPTLYGTMSTRLDVINEFNLDMSYLCATETKLAELVLGAKPIPGIQYKKILPHMYDNLQLKNKQLIDFYMREAFRKGETEIIEVCGAKIKIGAGGAHSAIEKYYSPKFLYFDVSGYYNLIMLNCDLLPRTMPEESKELYRKLYYKQLEYKKTNPKKRAALKVVLLAVFGAMTNEYTAFYDPEKGTLVTITGILFICDLLEKLEGLITVIQTNTDGIMIEPLDWNDYDKIISIVEEWEKRTGFVIKKELKYNLWQRDVNNYFFVEENGKVYTKGEAVRTYNNYDDIFNRRTFDSKEPLIVAKSIVDYLLYNITPEETIEKNKRNLRLFQCICKKNSYDYLEYEESKALKDENNNYILNKKNQIVYELTICKRVQNVNRVFARKDIDILGMIYKHKIDKKGKHCKSKVSNLPNSIFIYNNEILSEETVNKLIEEIDYDYYVKRSYERILEFVGEK